MSPIVVNGEGQVVRVIKQAVTLRVIAGGPRGVPGPQGPPGTSATGKRWYGAGPPTLIVGSSPGDEYIDSLTGTLYVLT
jgi:hypothetical protein